MEEIRRSKEKNLLLLMMGKEQVMIVIMLLLTKNYPLIQLLLNMYLLKLLLTWKVVECDENIASVSKIFDVELVEEETFDEEITSYRLLDMSILNNVFNSLACPERSESGTFNLQGFVRYLILKCSNCLFSRHFDCSILVYFF